MASTQDCSSGDALLLVADLAVRYGRAVQALRNVSLTVPPGGIVAVLGSNGAGKSTLMRTVSGTYRLHRATIERGSVTFEGRDMTGRRPADMVSAGIVQVPEGRRIFSRLTVEENLRAGGIRQPSRRARAQAREQVYSLFPVLRERRRQRAGLLSGGEQQMLAIGRALMVSPKLLLLDEPSLGLAPRIVGKIAEVITEINQQGTAVLLVEQNATMALQVSRSAYVLGLGQVLLSGPVEELRRSDEVQRLYLGEGSPHSGPGPVRTDPERRQPSLTRWTYAAARGGKR